MSGREPLFVSQPDFVGGASWQAMLGRVDGNTVWAPPYWPVGIFGAARAGKTESSVATIVGWPGPALILSVRDDLARITVSARAQRGGVALYDPSETVGADIPRCGWNPLDECHTQAGAVATAKWLVEATRGEGLTDAGFWYALSVHGLWPHLFAAAVNRYTFQDVHRQIHQQEDFEVRALLQAAGNEAAIIAAEALWGREERVRSSVYTTMEQALSVFDQPTAMASTFKGFDLDAFLSGPNTLYACAPGDQQSMYAPLFTAVIGSVIRAAYNTQARTGMPAGLLIVIDEAANIVRLENLDELITTGAGTGIQLITIWHTLAQIYARYGPDADTIIENLSVILALPSRDRRMIDLLDGLSDDADAATPRGFDRLRGLSRGQAVYVLGTQAPKVIDLVTRFNAPDLRLILEMGETDPLDLEGHGLN